MRLDFFSDNSAGACPEVMAALAAANYGFAAPYGRDEVTASAVARIRELLSCDTEVRFLPSGTAGNALACAMLCRPFEAVVAHQSAHIMTHEAGAPGFLGSGLGLMGVPGASAKINPAALRRAIASSDAGNGQPLAALSLTNATECGTLYTLEEMRVLSDMARSHGLGVHLDGARLANAAAAGLDVTALASSGIDVMVLGGTKAGATLSDALIIFNRGLTHHLDARMKQMGQLPSKGRMLAAPWLGLLEIGEDGIQPWLRHAAHANAMARKLAALMPFPIAHTVQTNAVFAQMPECAFQRLLEVGWKASRTRDGSVRFVCSWAVTGTAVEQLGEALRTLT